MEERATLTLNCEEIKNILFKYYFGEHKEIVENGKMTYELLRAEGGSMYAMDINFILSYDEKIESLNCSINREFIVGLYDLTKIIKEQILDYTYKVESLYKYVDDDDNLSCITYKLSKKEKVKTKKRGWKRNV